MPEEIPLEDVVEPLPSASVLILREENDELEVMMVKRRHGSDYTSAAWVFPGGLIEAGETAAQAVVRETEEEIGLKLDENALYAYQSWTTPTNIKKRFTTQFFIGQFPPDAQLQIDNNEIVDQLWWPLAEIDAMLQHPDYKLLFPTYMCLKAISAMGNFEELQSNLHRWQGLEVKPQMELIDGRPHLQLPEIHGIEKLLWDALAFK